MKIKNLFVFDEYMRKFVLGSIVMSILCFFECTYFFIFRGIKMWQYLVGIFVMPLVVLFALRLYQRICRILGVNERYENLKNRVHNKK